jgi:aminomuconate-semialdehyde/2-hydroxymuconate-6-semialdehyde dehydrogenase
VQRIPHFIANEPAEPASAEWLDVVEPATGRPYAAVAAGNATDVDRAVSAARAAFPAWSETPAAERSRLLLAVAARIEADLDAFARAETIDSGKPITLARTVDIPRAIANLRFFATAILHWSSESHATDRTALNYTLRRPRGVAGLISPWNLPLYLLTWKIAPAVATGNTAVAKPSELTPMTAHLLAEAWRAAGVPAGVLNVVHGTGPSAGAALVADPDVATVSFTGGTKTGAEIARATAPTFKKIALEMGGKNPTVVFADADMDRAVPEAVRAAFSNQGQICLCGSRVLVERAAWEPFVARFVSAARALRIGDPLDPATEQGALVSRAHLDRVLSYVELAREEGGTVLCGGRAPENLPERVRGGFFLEPTVIAGLAQDCRVNREEIFGPVVTLIPFDTEDEAVAWANDTPYGLAASVWTENLGRAHRVADRIESGTVWVNCWMLRDLRVPFGGTKSSGIEREGGEEALRFFTEPKNVCLRL